MPSCSCCLHFLVFHPAGLPAIDSDCTVYQFIFINLNNDLLLLFLLFLQTHQLSLLLQHAFSLFRDVVIRKQLDGLISCDLWSV